MINRLICIFFSATETTRRYVFSFSKALGRPINVAINMADNLSAPMPKILKDDLVVVASPVYGGRLPAHVSSRFQELSGNHAKAVSIVVFGNRDYDDALLELTDILTSADFDVIGAGAFIGQHSIFPKVAASRPDDRDIEALGRFAAECMQAIGRESKVSLPVKGNRPYKKISGVPLSPAGNRDLCIRCGRCVEMCPVGAIAASEPHKSDSSLCISCGRCIMVCPRHTRKHSGLKYSLLGALFSTAFKKRKEPEYTVIP